MADAAQAITNGYRKAGFTGIRGMCWFHVTKALKSRLAKLKDQVAVEIRQDIHFLQLSQNPKIFNGGYATFIEKWSNCIEPEDSESYFAVASEPVINFLEYFDHEWYVSYPNWFEGYSDPNNVAAPSTNNGNEGVNGRIKIEDTFREQLSMGEFCVVSFKMISKWSKWADSSNSKSKPFKTLPKPSLTVWTNAFLWNKSGIDIVSLSSELNHYYVKSGDSDLALNEEVVLAYKRLMLTAKFSSFDQYYSTAFGYYCIKMPEDMNNSNWLTGTCTCPAYYKHYICKHILGIALRYGAQFPLLCDANKVMPPEANPKFLNGTSRGPGRPRKVPKALEVIRHAFSSILIEDADNVIYEENSGESILSQTTIETATAIENLLVNQNVINESEPVYTQLISEQTQFEQTPSCTQAIQSTQTIASTQIRYNKDGSIAKKRGPKPKPKS
jgi:hypothetical protein